jgi:hypothetical protein
MNRYVYVEHIFFIYQLIIYVNSLHWSMVTNATKHMVVQMSLTTY